MDTDVPVVLDLSDTEFASADTEQGLALRTPYDGVRQVGQD